MKKLFVLSLIVLFLTPALWAQGEEDFSTPLAAFQTYIRACQSHDFDAVDNCFTKEFNRFKKSNKEYMKHRNMGQLDNELSCVLNKEIQVDLHSRKAIIYLYPEDRKTSPYFMTKEGGQWKIDGMFMWNNIIFDQKDEWHWGNGNKEKAFLNS
ncbi:MAG: hypothetical protein PHG40_00885 [Candidatus Omnitrophica bacterium]|nr:hypothetical protein [Candidatus Omnitrophota bacterium]